MRTFSTTNLHFSAFLLEQGFPLIDIELVNPQLGTCQFTFEKKPPGLDVGNLEKEWLLNRFTVGAKSIFESYVKLRMLVDRERKQQNKGERA